MTSRRMGKTLAHSNNQAKHTDLVESGHDGGGVRDPCGLEEDAVERVSAVEEVDEGLHQVAAHRAAHAAVVHCHDVFRLRRRLVVRRWCCRWCGFLAKPRTHLLRCGVSSVQNTQTLIILQLYMA